MIIYFIKLSKLELGGNLMKLSKKIYLIVVLSIVLSCFMVMLYSINIVLVELLDIDI